MDDASHPLPYRLALIEWTDASRLSDGWMDLSDIPVPYTHRCVSVGFVISENEHGKVIVPTVGDVEHENNQHIYGGMLIPAASIISVRELA